MGLFAPRIQKTTLSDAMGFFLGLWELQTTVDETALCAGILDAVRSGTGERPCCVWKKESRLFKVSERGMVDLPDGGATGTEDKILMAVVESGTLQFDGRLSNTFTAGLRGYEGYVHLPIKIRDKIWGLLSVAVLKKEVSDANFIQPVELLCRTLGLALRSVFESDETHNREKQLKAEVHSATRELEQTNKQLIERVRELKTLYKELHKRVLELTKANRAKDEFLSIVSHELRTPLTSLTGFLSVLLEEEAGPLNDQQRKFLTITKQSATRLNLLISDLLDISRIEMGRLNMAMDVCDMNEILERCVYDLKSVAAGKGITLDLQVAASLPDVLVDANRIQQVIDNLISNAIKFTERGGQINVMSEDKGDFVQVSVRDTGRGMTTEEQNRVFDMFYQADASTRRPAGGAGLGLAIARGIVVMHGGQIVVESEAGIGSTFSFVIPRHKEKKAA